jgi:hypothetical protein
MLRGTTQGGNETPHVFSSRSNVVTCVSSATKFGQYVLRRSADEIFLVSPSAFTISRRRS